MPFLWENIWSRLRYFLLEAPILENEPITLPLQVFTVVKLEGKSYWLKTKLSGLWLHYVTESVKDISPSYELAKSLSISSYLTGSLFCNVLHFCTQNDQDEKIAEK